MIALSPRIRFFVIVGISVFVTAGFGWYNYDILSEIKDAEGIIKGLDRELRGQDKVRKNIVDTQTRREILISELDSNVIHSSKDHELAATKMHDLAKEHGIVILSLNLRSRDTFPPLNQYTKVKQVPLERQRIDLRLNGEFLDIGPFFDAVEKQIKSVNLHSYNFSLDQNAARKVIADVVYYTYRMDRES